METFNASSAAGAGGGGEVLDATPLRGGVDPFQHVLGKALHASSFAGGRAARRAALARELLPVWADTLLVAAADAFWPTPGSTMSESMWFLRAIWHRPGAQHIASCEEILRGYGDGQRKTPTM